MLENGVNNFLLTGRPGIGKTTLIKELASWLGEKAEGFYTEEIREKGKRKGFKIKTLGGKEGILAHKNFKSPYRVGRYGINLGDLEKIGLAALEKALKEKKIILLDEIGRMELFSFRFEKMLKTLLASPLPLVATIGKQKDPKLEKIKRRKDIKLIGLTEKNREKVILFLKRELLPRGGND